MKDLINEQPEQDIEHCATCIHAADSEDICILRKCKYAISELKDCYEPERRWIPCSERLPESGHSYLYCTDMGTVHMGFYWGGLGFGYGFDYGYNIVAWMPLPQPYKGEKHG